MSPKVLDSSFHMKLKAQRKFAEESLQKNPLGTSRPTSRKDCESGPRPCPWVSCRHHLALEVLGNGSIRHLFPDLEIWEMKETCALDVAERGGRTLDEVGITLNCTREWVRLVEEEALELVIDHLLERV